MNRMPRVNDIRGFGSHGRKLERKKGKKGKQRKTGRNEPKYENSKGKIAKSRRNEPKYYDYATEQNRPLLLFLSPTCAV